MKTINYKGKGEHSVRELELIIEQQAEELHLIKSEQLPKRLSNEAYTIAKGTNHKTFTKWWDMQKV